MPPDPHNFDGDFDGVGCESCHGPASGWISTHYAKPATHAANIANGLVPLDRPQARNAFTFAMYERLSAICEQANTDKSIKALVMSEEYELGTYERDSQILRVDQMYDGVEVETYTR